MRAVTNRGKSAGASRVGKLRSSKSSGGHRPTSTVFATGEEKSFVEVVEMIQAARGRALTAVNTALIDLYWQVGEFISRRIEKEGWGKSTVAELSIFSRSGTPGCGVLSPKPLENAPVLRRLRRSARTLNTVERTPLVFESAHFDQIEAARGARVLPPHGHATALVGTGSRPPNRRRHVRARGSQ